MKNCLYILFVLLPVMSNAAIDSVYSKSYNQMRYFDSDSLFKAFADNGKSSVTGDYFYYCREVCSYLSEVRVKSEISKMRRYAKEYRNKDLTEEADLLEASLIDQKDDKQLLKYKLDRLQKIIDKAKKNNNTQLKARAMEECFDALWVTKQPEYYSEVIKRAYYLIPELKKLTDEQYPGRREALAKIGEMYYFFGDYAGAVKLLKMSLHSAEYYFQTYNLKARNTLGVYFLSKNMLDSAFYYFNSNLESKDSVMNRSVHNAIAKANIASIYYIKKEYSEAVKLYNESLPEMLSVSDASFASGITIGLGKCYLESGDLRSVKSMIDSTERLIRVYNDTRRYKSLYPLISKYYIETGDKINAKKYIDSILIADRKDLRDYNQNYIIWANEEIFKDEIQKESARKHQYRKSMIFGFLFGVISLIVSLTIWKLYIQKRNAYKSLAQQAEKWASEFDQRNIEKTDNVKKQSYDSSDIDLVKKLNELLTKEKLYISSDLNINFLADHFGIHRNLLSKSINAVTGNNFSTFINEYRVKEAINIIKRDKKSSISEIALMAGFNNRKSFYEAFKRFTGLSPTEFSNNL